MVSCCARGLSPVACFLVPLGNTPEGPALVDALGQAIGGKPGDLDEWGPEAPFSKKMDRNGNRTVSSRGMRKPAEREARRVLLSRFFRPAIGRKGMG